MDIPRHLRDVYRFPGFVPTATVRAHSADPDGIILALRRRRKKRSAVIVGNLIAASTISGHASFAISPAATNEFTSP